jgi:hypothetical protein
VKALEHAKAPLGHGLWVFDAYDTNNYWRRTTIRFVSPEPASAFEVRVFGPFLIVRSQEPVVTPERFLKLSREVELTGKCPGLCIGDADVNLQTVLQTGPKLDRYEASRSRSTVSR